MVEDDERALVGGHRHVEAGKAGHPATPGSGRVHHELAGDVLRRAVEAVHHVHAGHAAVGLGDADDLAVGENFAAVAPGAHGVVQHEPKAVDGGVGHPEDALDVGRHAGLQAEGLGGLEFLGRDAGLGAALDPLVHVVRVVLRREHEEALGVAHAAVANAAQDHVFPYAFRGRFGVAHGVAAAAVQEAVEAGACAVAYASLLQQERGDATHGKVAQHAGSGGAAADDDNSGFLHVKPPEALCGPERNGSRTAAERRSRRGPVPGRLARQPAATYARMVPRPSL